MSGRIDWAGMLAQALGPMKLDPDRFWGLTPHEWSLMRGVAPGGVALDRAALSALMARFPDQQENNG